MTCDVNLPGFILILRQRMESWPSCHGVLDLGQNATCTVFRYREEAEAERETMQYPRDWDVVPVIVSEKVNP